LQPRKEAIQKKVSTASRDKVSASEFSINSLSPPALLLEQETQKTRMKKIFSRHNRRKQNANVCFSTAIEAAGL
jgi:hypothetical protein